jgi:excisionase family DNA binding protein
MNELQETATGEPIGDINGATITSGVGPANKPTNSRTKRDALYKPLFESYFTSEAVRNQMAKALLDELSPHFISAFMLRGEGAINVTAEDILKQDGEDYAQKVVWDTIMRKLDNGAFTDGPDRRGNMRTGFHFFRSYVAEMKKVGYDEADRLLGEIEIHVPLLVEEEGEDAGFGNGKFSEVDNPLLISPAEFNQTGTRRGESVQPSAPPDLKELVIIESLNDDTKRKLENWQACDFDRNEMAKLMSIPGHEVTPGNMSTQIFRIIRPRQLQYLGLTLAHQFGELQAKEAAEDIFDRIPVLRQRKFADYPKTWAEASELELRPKVRKVKEDALKSSWVQSVRCLSRLWARDKSLEYTEQPEGSNVVSIEPVEAPSASACHKAFEFVVCRYQESQGSAVGLQAINYEKAAKSGHGSKVTSKVKPTISDFMADVEICVRRCLTPPEQGYFNLYYASCAVVVEPKDVDCLKKHIESFPEKYRAAVASIDKRIRLKLGARLIEVGISPFSEYVREFDVRQPKLKEKLSGMLLTIRACAEEFEDESNLLEWPEQNSFDIQACAEEIAFEPLLGVVEAAKLLCVHPKTLQALARSGSVPCIRFGKYWRFRASVLDAWVRERLISDHQSRRVS